MLIGVVGTLVAGKSTAVRFLEEQGFKTLSLSNFLREKALNRNLKVDRDTLFSIGNECREKFGPAVLMEEALNRIRASPGDYAIDSIRTLAEVELLKTQSDAHIIGVSAEIETRFHRAVERSSRSDREETAHTITEFIQQETRENSEDPTRPQLQKVLAAADVVIENDGTLDDFKERVVQELESLKAKRLPSSGET